MGLLRKPYEISYWEDVWDSSAAKYVEKRMFTIGSNTMDYQARAIEPVLTRKTNGEVNFSFKMYYQYIDNVTGEKVDNPFTPYLKNESKIKLKYNGEWFDLLIKNINKDSATKSYTYQLVDQHVTELSKNGFNVTLDSSLMNNLGTAEELGNKILADTDWTATSEKIVQTNDEALVTLMLISDISAYLIEDDNLTSKGAVLSSEPVTIASGKYIYAFYSCCSGEKPYRFQFIYKDDNKFNKDSDRIITNQKSQYCVDNITSWASDGIFTIPTWAALTMPETDNNSALSILYRGKKYIFSQDMRYHSGLNMYLPVYETSDETEYFEYTKTNYVTPNLIKNLVINEDFDSTAGWMGNKFCRGAYILPEEVEPKRLYTYLRERPQWQWDEYSRKDYEGYWQVSAEDATEEKNGQLKVGDIIYIDGVITDKERTPIRLYAEIFNLDAVNKNGNNKDYPNVGARTLGVAPVLSGAVINRETLRYFDGKLYSAIDDMYDSLWNADRDYFSVLSCTNMAKHAEYYLNKVITNSGPYSQRNSLSGFTKNEKYIVELAFYYAKKDAEQDGYVIQATLPENKDAATGNLLAQVKVRLANFMPLMNRGDYHHKQWEHNQYYEKDDEGKIYDWDDNGVNDRVLFYSPAQQNPKDTNYYGNITCTDGLFSYSQEVTIKGSLSAEEFAKDSYKFFIEFLSSGGISNDDYFFIKHFRVYKKIPRVPTEDNPREYYTPDDEIDTSNFTYNTEKQYFKIVGNETKTEKQIVNEISASSLKPKLSSYGEKRTQVNIKESNYFNGIQSIAETFECWPKLDVAHDSDGNILTQQIKFQNYVGQDNYAGFRYGVNSKDIKRSLDSKQIVSKLIVKANANEFGKNGFCTIARAATNNIKDNVLYDFGYYIGQHLLDATTVQNHLYIGVEGDVTTEGTLAWELLKINYALGLQYELPEDGLDNYIQTFQGYYPKISRLNLSLEFLSQQISDYSVPLAQETATYNTYKPMYDSAVEELEKAKQNFYAIAGFQFESIGINEELAEGEETRMNKVRNSITLSGYLEKILTYTQNAKDAKLKYESAEKNKAEYEEKLEILNIQYNNALKLKSHLNKKFYTAYSRFIQEGTWIDESYLDDNLYYNDAMSVLYTSSMPQVSYSLNVLSLAGIPGYELFDFQIGDQTFVEDTEFFGYDTDGCPRRELITVTETTENLDDPTKNSIKVQNYENQFKDLFQRITATVQSVQYSEGAYDRAEELAMADKAHKLQFLAGALSDASTTFTNDGAQDYTLDANGLTLTSQVTGKRLRAKGGAILLGTVDRQGNETWKTGLTEDGISADLITAGQVNTGVIQIMNYDEPTFRWDTHGITAYSFGNTNSDTYLTEIDTTKGVRFDRFGLYGYSGIDGETWKPKSISGGNNGMDGDVPNIDSKSTFAITWEGLKVTGNAGVEARLGKDNVNILSITKGTEPILTISNGGDLELTGQITATEGGSIAGWSINTNSITKGELGKDGFHMYSSDYSSGTHFGALESQYWALGIGNNFGVTYTGHIYAIDGTFTGTVNATEGSIGGWSLGDIKSDWYWANGTGQQYNYSDSLYSIQKSGNDYYLMFLRAGSANQHCIAIRKKTGASSENGSGTVSTIFSLTREGKLTATDTDITGIVKATGGRIGSETTGFLISDSALGTYSFNDSVGYSGTQISVSNGITSSKIKANTFFARNAESVSSTSADVGAIYFIWPALGYSGGDVGTEYYGAVTSKGIQIIYQSDGKWFLAKTLISY